MHYKGYMLKNNSKIARFFLLFIFFISSVGMKGLVKNNDDQQEKQITIKKILIQEAPGLSAKSKEEIAVTVTKLADEYHLDPLLILAIIHVESHFKPEAQSSKGAMGLMQVKPIVVADVAQQLGINPKVNGQLLKNKKFNMRVGVHYLASLIKRFKGDVCKAVMAYNAGPTTVSRIYAGKSVPLNGYQEKVLRTYLTYSQS